MRTVSLLFHDVYAADPRESGFASPAADRYKLSLQQFDAQLAGLAQVRADAPVLVQEVSGDLTASARRVAVRHDSMAAGSPANRRGPPKLYAKAEGLRLPKRRSLSHHGG